MDSTQFQVSSTAYQDEVTVMSAMASPARAGASRPKPAKMVRTKQASLTAQPQATSSLEEVENSTTAICLPGASSMEDSFQEVEKLQDCGINAADLKKLKEAGLHSALSVIYTTKKDLCNIKGLSEQKVEKIVEAARKLTDAGFVSAVEFSRQKCAFRYHLSTGASKVDQLLGGGFESSTITEIFGEFRCGKTQICHAVSVIAQMPRNLGGMSARVCYIDTENTFRPDRIQAIAAHYNINPETALENILYARCYTSDHLVQLLVQVAAKMAEEKFALLIIDSIMAPFRVDFSGRGELAERQQILSRVMGRLQKLSEEFNIAVVITNQVMSDPAASLTFAANPPKPIGGHIIAHFSTTRLSLRKGRAEQRIIKIYDSPNLPEGDAVYEICERGIQDAKE